MDEEKKVDAPAGEYKEEEKVADEAASTDTAAGADQAKEEEKVADEAASTDTAAKTEDPKVGDPCTCPDGRKGTITEGSEGLVCLPNHDQGE